MYLYPLYQSKVISFRSFPTIKFGKVWNTQYEKGALRGGLCQSNLHLALWLERDNW